AKDVQAKIIGEGANLAVTQLGRIEFALLGGAINTDAIDNSAGVDCSDHEVNLKIFFNQLIQKNALTYDQRDDMMRAMETSVAQHVLRNTAQQVFLLSVLAHGAHNNTSVIEQFVDDMVKHPKMPLNKQVEYLPAYEELSNRFGQGQGYTRPELAIITAYAKNQLYQKLMEYIDPHLYESYYLAYFPSMMVLEYKDQLQDHPLHKEILCTVLANYMINRVGPHFIHGIMNARGAAHHDIVHAFFAIHQITNLGDVWNQISDSTNLSLMEKYKAWEKLSNIMRQMIMSYLRKKSVFDQTQHHDMALLFQNLLLQLTGPALTLNVGFETLMNRLSHYPLALELCSYGPSGFVSAINHINDSLKHLWDATDFPFLMVLLNDNKFETSWEIGTKYNFDDDILNMMGACMISAIHQDNMPHWLEQHTNAISVYQNHLKIAKCAHTSDEKNLGVISYIVKQLALLNEQLGRDCTHS
ncbi:MAG: NAD-glutamate dehydrogenase, partial [Alphaproteobacteria bacterium]|nr:NAD-glutamate dehydrogenase [Alphaproteobacteria bacterium]